MRKYTKEELETTLNKEKWMISSRAYEYYNNLINLDYSVLREYISREQRDILSLTRLYNKIAVYNIYERSLNIIKKYVKDIDIHDSQILVASNYYNNKDLVYFMYVYGCIRKRLGNIILFQSYSDNDKYNNECSLTYDVCSALLEDYGIDYDIDSYNNSGISYIKSTPSLSIVKKDKYLK